MAVPAGEVLSWLASGALEQVGLLPNKIAAVPVFTVLTPELRADLTARLATIGKPTVVLTPLRVRSFLMRAVNAPDGARGDGEADLAQLLAQAAQVSGELEAMLDLAAEEARLEALELATELGGNEGPAFSDGGEADAPFPDDVDACFDLADLEAAIGGGGAPEAAAAPAEEAEPEAAAAPSPPAATAEGSVEEPSEQRAVPAAAAAVHSDDDAVAPPVAEEVPSAPAADVAIAAAAPSEAPPTERVETLLGLLKDAVVELAQRPEPPRVDMRPFVVAMQASLDRSAEQAAATAGVLQSLDERVDSLGERIAQVAARPPMLVAAPAAHRSPVATAATPASPLPLAMAGLAVLAVAWSILFWLELDAPRLAAGTLVGANVAGCLLLSSWWRRG